MTCTPGLTPKDQQLASSKGQVFWGWGVYTQNQRRMRELHAPVLSVPSGSLLGLPLEILTVNVGEGEAMRGW